jgi:hypothetical protein
LGHWKVREVIKWMSSSNDRVRSVNHLPESVQNNGNISLSEKRSNQLHRKWRTKRSENHPDLSNMFWYSSKSHQKEKVHCQIVCHDNQRCTEGCLSRMIEIQ